MVVVDTIMVKMAWNITGAVTATMQLQWTITTQILEILQKAVN